jgi:serine/threonine protein kinase
LETLGVGAISTVYLANRISMAPLLATIKVSSAPQARVAYAREEQALRELQALDSEGAGAFFTRMIPSAIAQGAVEGEEGRHALVLKHPVGFWGSLAALHDRFPTGLDPRHVVWIWRRMLEALGFVHRYGWAHNDLRPEHALVHLEEHAVRLIGWGEAKRGVTMKIQAEDLCRSARVIQVLLSGERGRAEKNGDVPASLGALVNRAAEDRDFCREHGAAGLDALLREQSQKAFGPPQFVPLTI